MMAERSLIEKSAQTTELGKKSYGIAEKLKLMVQDCDEIFSTKISETTQKKKIKEYFRKWIFPQGEKNLDSMNNLYAGTIYLSLVKNGSDEQKDALGMGSVEDIREMLPGKFKILAENVRNHLVDNKDLQKIIDEFDKNIEGKPTLEDYKNLYEKIEKVSLTQAEEDQKTMMLATVYEKIVEVEQDKKEKHKEKKKKKESGDEKESGIENEKLEQGLIELVSRIKNDKEFGEVTVDDYKDYKNILKKLYQIKDLSDADKAVIRDFKKSIDEDFGGKLDGGQGNKGEDKKEDKKEINLKNIFESYGIHYDSADEAANRVKDINKKYESGRIGGIQESQIIDSVREYLLAAKRIQLLEKKIVSGGNLNPAYVEIVQSEKKKLLDMVIALDNKYKEIREKEWQDQPDSEKKEEGKFVYKGLPDIHNYFVDSKGEILSDKTEFDEEELRKWRIEQMVNPDEVDQRDMAERFYRRRMMTEDDDVQINPEKYWKDFRAYHRTVTDKNHYSEQLISYLMADFPMYKPPGLDDLHPGFKNMDDLSWRDIIIPVNDLHEAALAWDSKGNSANYVEFLQAISKSLFSRDYVSILNKFPAVMPCIKEMMHYLCESFRDETGCFRLKWSEKGQRDLANKDRGTIRKEAQYRIQQKINKGVEGYGDLKALFDDKNGRLLFDVAWETAWNMLYSSGFFALVKQDKTIMKEEPKWNWALNEENTVEAVGAKTHKGFGCYTVNQLVDGRLIKKWPMSEYADYDEKGKLIMRHVGRDQEGFSYGGPMGHWVGTMLMSPEIHQRAAGVAIVDDLYNMEQVLMPDGGFWFTLLDWVTVTDRSSNDPSKWREISLTEALFSEEVTKFDVPVAVKKINKNKIEPIIESEVMLISKDEERKQRTIFYKDQLYLEWINDKGEKEYFTVKGNDSNRSKRLTTAEWKYVLDFMSLMHGKFNAQIEKGDPSISVSGILADARDIVLQADVPKRDKDGRIVKDNDGNPIIETKPIRPFKFILHDPQVIAHLLLQLDGVYDLSQLTLQSIYVDKYTNNYSDQVEKIFGPRGKIVEWTGIEYSNPEFKILTKEVLKLLTAEKQGIWGRDKGKAQRDMEEDYFRRLENGERLHEATMREGIDHYKKYIKPGREIEKARLRANRIRLIETYGME